MLVTAQVKPKLDAHIRMPPPEAIVNGIATHMLMQTGHPIPIVTQCFSPKRVFTFSRIALNRPSGPCVNAMVKANPNVASQQTRQSMIISFDYGQNLSHTSSTCFLLGARYTHSQSPSALEFGNIEPQYFAANPSTQPVLSQEHSLLKPKAG